MKGKGQLQHSDGNKGQDKQNKKNLKALNARYTQRITLVKLGKEAMNNQNYLQAIKQYNSYIKIISEVKNVDEQALDPLHFDQASELSEMMLLSHVYWDLCKIYDNAPNLEMQFQRCLQKFIDFTTNQKYQVVNAEMLRKTIHRIRLVHKRDFEMAYKKIYISSKRCFIVTYCYGEEHAVTNNFRKFKNVILTLPFGLFFVRSYYLLSPKLILFLDYHPSFRIFIPLIRSALYILSKVLYFTSRLTKR